MRTIFHLVENHRGIPNLHTSRESQPSLKRLFITKARQRQSLQNLFISSVFFCVGVGIFVHSIVAVTSTKHVCAPHPHCAVMSYQWNVNAEYCSCIVFVNRLTRVTTFNDWENPRDATTDLAALAKSGHLWITQIVNRALPTFPEELRQFHGMEQVIRIYSKTLRIPDWAIEWKALKYLHIEGDFTANRLTYMPDDLFAEMHDLAFLHLGSLTSLNLLVFADAIQVYKLPSLANLKKLQQFTIVFRNPVCCNGFITGKCDLSDFQCKPRVDKPVVQCTDERIPREELAMVDKVKVVLCSQNQKTDLKDSRPTVATTDEACGGVMYKQCTTPSGATGICYTARMMVISCDAAAGYDKMRRLQIARGVGEPCDPRVEAWLGCK
ncbi:hypothetical protein Poli38472_011390 [Pythium oligandrum]|uniref:WLGC domain-containing protein n=1 Tax=Pythium oligandrum TaxID=41045 RepID=A0A8K1CJP6_PYTOL|nr:hypothetical protein Poli38472_011390 [Pythium oligandrum]|eukprot:TMW64510.1 hypothetical protein Poli38472_011390 [Pythium oligandrum]